MYKKNLKLAQFKQPYQGTKASKFVDIKERVNKQELINKRTTIHKEAADLIR